jgi:hypothetical protein
VAGRGLESLRAAPDWLTTGYAFWSLCWVAGFAICCALLAAFGHPIEHSGDAIARFSLSILLGGLVGGTLLFVLLLLTTGSSGPVLIGRLPAAGKLAAMLLPGLVVAAAMVSQLWPRETAGAAIFHPTAGVLGGGNEEVELPLPPGWSAVYDLRQDWRSSHVRDAAGELAFMVTVDLTEREVPDCPNQPTPRGEAWVCRIVKNLAARPSGPWLRLEHYERWQGRVLAIAFNAPAARADELEPVARASLDAVRLRGR